MIGRAFVTGQGVRVAIPEGAAGISLGFNDAVSSGNGGRLSVVIQMPD